MQIKKIIITLILTTFWMQNTIAQTVVLEISQPETPASKATLSPGQTDVVFLKIRLTALADFSATGLHIPVEMMDKHVTSFTNFHLNVNGERWANAELHSQGYFLEMYQNIELDSLDSWDIEVIGEVTSDAENDSYIQVNADINMFLEPQWDTLSISNGIISGKATGTSFRVDAVTENTMFLSCNNCDTEINLESGASAVSGAHSFFVTNGTKPCEITMLTYQIYPTDLELAGMQAQLYIDGGPLGTPKWVDASNQINFNETCSFDKGQTREITLELIGTGNFNGVLQIGLIGTAFNEEYTGYALKWEDEYINSSNPLLGPTISIGGSFTSRLRCDNCLSAQSLVPNNNDGVKVLRFFLTNTSSTKSIDGYKFKLNSDSLDFSGWKGTIMASRPTYTGSETYYYDFLGSADIAEDGTLNILAEENAQLAKIFNLGETKEMYLRLNCAGGPNAEFDIDKAVKLTCSLTEIQGEHTQWNANELSPSNPFTGPEFTLVPQIDATIFCDNCLEDKHFDILPNQLDAINVSIKNHSTSVYTLQDIDFTGTGEGGLIYFDQWHGTLYVNQEPLLPSIQISEAEDKAFRFEDLAFEIDPGETKEFTLQIEPTRAEGQGSFRVGVSKIVGQTESPIEGGGNIDIFWNGEKLSKDNQFLGPVISFDATGYLEKDTVKTKSTYLKNATLEGDETEVLTFFIENGKNHVPLTDFSFEFLDTISFSTYLNSEIWVRLDVDDQPGQNWYRMWNALKIWKEVPFDTLQIRKFALIAKGLTTSDANRLFALTKITGGFNIVWDEQELSPFNPFYGSLLSTITAVQENPTQSEIRIYPNPAQDRIWVRGLSQSSVFWVYTITGQLVETSNFENEINCQLWQSGIYILYIETPTGIFNKKIIKL